MIVNALSIRPNFTGGGETYLKNLLREIGVQDKGENRYLVLVSKGTVATLDFASKSFEWLTLGKWIEWPLLRIAFENLILPALLILKQPDLYFSPTGIIPPLIRRRAVITVQNAKYFELSEERAGYGTESLWQTMREHLRRLYYRWWTPWSIVRASRVIVPSDALKRTILEHTKVDSSRIVVIHHGLDPFFEIKRHLPADSSGVSLPSKFILCVANASPHKNVDKLIQALALVNSQLGESYHLVLAGNYDANARAYLRNLACECGSSKYLVFAGYVPISQLPAFYAQASAFVLPSVCESFGLPLIEAMACGCPVISTPYSAIPEIVGDAGLLVNPYDIEGLAAAIMSVLTNPTLRQELSRKGVDRASKYRWADAARATIATFRAAVRGDS